ncbi:MAG: hypothetical protein P1U86_01205 [Verrucomicrobiales bacterium]|nr:hypothetical protein [Verrucomicrobiales bacterium]
MRHILGIATIALSFSCVVARTEDRALIGITASEYNSLLVWTIFEASTEEDGNVSLKALSNSEINRIPLIEDHSKFARVNASVFREKGVRPLFFAEDFTSKFGNTNSTKGAVLVPRAFFWGAGSEEGNTSLFRTIKIWTSALPEPFLGEFEGHFVKKLKEVAEDITPNSSASEFALFLSMYLERIIVVECEDLECLPNEGLILFKTKDSSADVLSTFSSFFRPAVSIELEGSGEGSVP